MRSFRILLAAFAVLSLVQHQANAQNTFSANSGNSWFENANWSGGAPPLDTEDAVISDSTITSVGAAGGVANSLTLGFGSTVTVTGSNTLTIDDYILANTGSTNLFNGSGNITVNGNDATERSIVVNAANGGFLGGGTMSFLGGVQRISSPGDTIRVQKNFVTGGTMTVDGDVDQTGVSWSNSGDLTYTGPSAEGWDLNNATITNTSTGTFNLSSQTIRGVVGTNSFTNDGVLNAVSGVSSISGLAFTSTAGSTINVADTATLTLGTVTATTNLTGGGTLGVGTLTLDGASAIQGGTGDTGTLDITGNLVAGGTTLLTLNLGAAGVTDLTGNGVAVSGDVNLAGADLNIDLSSFVATQADAGKSFAFLTSGGTFTGEFASFADGVEFTQGGFTFAVDYAGGASLRLVSAVPEPSSLALLGLVAVGSVMRRRRR